MLLGANTHMPQAKGISDLHLYLTGVPGFYIHLIKHIYKVMCQQPKKYTAYKCVIYATGKVTNFSPSYSSKTTEPTSIKFILFYIL